MWIEKKKKKEKKNIQTASNTRHEIRCARRQAEGSHKFMIDRSCKAQSSHWSKLITIFRDIPILQIYWEIAIQGKATYQLFL